MGAVLSVCAVVSLVGAVVAPELSDDEEQESDPLATSAATASRLANRVTAQA
jgi:predicted regulator of Ras-like GTPase activity (Roadblock/LC7/MglB family)